MDPSGFVDKIYEAAVLPDLWVEVLESLGKMFETKGALLFADSPDGTKWLGGGAVTGLMKEFVTGGWMAHNVRGEEVIKRKHPGFLTDLDICTEEETYTLPVFKEFLRPKGIFAGAGTFIPGLNEDRVMLTVEGFQSHQAARAAVPHLDELRPHLARAAMLSSQFKLERIRGYVEALEAVGAAAAVVNSRGNLQAVNHRFQAELGKIVLEFKSTVRLADRVSNAQLLRAMTEIRSGRDGGRSIALRSNHENASRVLHVLPVKGEANDIFTNASAILILTNPRQRLSLPAALLQDLFDLTPAESRLASCIGAGGTLREIADESGLSMNTIKCQLKSVFSKTGANRQSDLVRLLISASAP